MSENSMGVPNCAGWRELSFEELCQTLSRGTAPSYVAHSSVMAIGQRCVQNTGFDATQARPHDARATGVLWAQPGDVLLNSTGTGTIGRSCIFECSRSFMVDSHVTVLRARRSKVDPRWLNLALRSSWGQRHLESHCYTGSTNQIELSRKELAKTSIPVPDLEEQRRIAEILDTLDDQIACQRRVVDKLDAIAHGLTEEQIALVAENVNVARLDEVADIGSGVTLGGQIESGVKLPYLRVANVQDGYIDTSEIKMVRVARSEVARYLLEPGDVLLTEGGDIDKLGRGAVWDGRIDPCICQNHIFRVRCRQEVVRPEFLAAYTGSVEGKAYFLGIAKQTTNLATINSTQLKAMPIPLPPVAEQDKFICMMKEVKSRRHAEVATTQKLVTLKQGLAEDLLTGRVRVPEAEAVVESL